MRGDPESTRQRLRRLAEIARLASRVARESGMIGELTVAGARAAVTALAGAPSPAQIYRFLAAMKPSASGLLWRDEVLTFRQIDARVDALAAFLARRGFGPDRGVVLLMKNRPEFVLAAAAAARASIAAICVSWRSTAAELAYLVAHSGAAGICFEAPFWPVVEWTAKEVPAIRDGLIVVGSAGPLPGCTRFEDARRVEGPGVRPPRRSRRGDAAGAASEADARVVVYTSGTTGKPKGAVRTFRRDSLPAALQILAETHMRVDDIHLVPCPLYHSTAFGFLTLSHLTGASVVLMEEFDPEGLLEHVQRFGVTTMAVVPTMLHKVLALGPEVLARYDTRSLRLVFSCGAPLPGPLAAEFMDHFGDVLYNFYGSTETGLVTVASPTDLRAAPGTIGRAIAGNEVRLLDDSGAEVAPGSVGELYVRSQMLIAGYHADDAATRASMRDGAFSVGDLARQDRLGRYFLEGRKRDLIISGGVNVYPAEVEAALEAHPDIDEVAVVGIADLEWGERVRAFVVCKAGKELTPAVVQSWARERLSGAKVPRDVVFLPTLPRNPTGKVLKRELVGRAGQAVG